MRLLFASAVLALAVSVVASEAKEFPYNKRPIVKVGQTVVLKGVRAPDCRGAAPTWAAIAGGMPKAAHGKFSDGGVGTTLSKSCNGTVAARGVLYTGSKAGSESFTIFGDKFTVVVK
ncbi:hypothetical protein RUR49_19535 [Pseudoxanthobacter sp. M-2]|uniref:hypothetical protein n=1 Tax=Pseudoxanthobacter sp. M-2 TaxID=3078754 RepID=UPI0038FBEDDA